MFLVLDFIRPEIYFRHVKEKLIRFGQQGVKGAGKNPKTAKEKARKKSYYARHNAQDKNPDKFSARYWSHKVKW